MFLPTHASLTVKIRKRSPSLFSVAIVYPTASNNSNFSSSGKSGYGRISLFFDPSRNMRDSRYPSLVSSFFASFTMSDNAVMQSGALYHVEWGGLDGWMVSRHENHQRASVPL